MAIKNQKFKRKKIRNIEYEEGQRQQNKNFLKKKVQEREQKEWT